MYPKTTLGSACLLAVALLTTASRAQEPEPLQARIREAARELMREHHVPGIAIACLRDGAVAWTEGVGYANREQRREVTPETIFNVGSVSKVIAAWGFMQQVEAGKIALDTPVEAHLSRWHLPESEFDAQGVNLRRILSHSAGLSLHGYPGFLAGEPLPTLEESLSGATGGRGGVFLMHAPGTRFQYSGGGFTLAQLLLEELTGEDFASYMQREVLKPLGMTSSAFGWSDEILARAATPYDEEGREIEIEYFTALAAAGLQTTVSDLAKFAIASLGREGDVPPDVLRAETIHSMTTPVAEGAPYGISYWQADMLGVRTVGHAGSNTGWQAVFLVELKTGDGLVMLSNGANGETVLRGLYAIWARDFKARYSDSEASETSSPGD